MVLERVAAIQQNQQQHFNSAALAIAGKGSVTPLLKPRVTPRVTINLDDDEYDNESYQRIVEPRNDLLHGCHVPAGFGTLTPEEFMELAADLEQDHANQLQALKKELEAQKLESAAMEESKNATNRCLRAAYGDEKRLREEAERELEHFRQLPPQQPWERLANEREVSLLFFSLHHFLIITHLTGAVWCNVSRCVDGSTQRGPKETTPGQLEGAPSLEAEHYKLHGASCPYCAVPCYGPVQEEAQRLLQIVQQPSNKARARRVRIKKGLGLCTGCSCAGDVILKISSTPIHIHS